LTLDTPGATHQASLAVTSLTGAPETLRKSIVQLDAPLLDLSSVGGRSAGASNASISARRGSFREASVLSPDVTVI